MQLRNLLMPFAVLGILATIFYSEYIVRPPAKDDKIHITYWEKWTGFEGDAIRATVDEYNRSQNRIHVDLLTISSIEKKTMLAVAGGRSPGCGRSVRPQPSPLCGRQCCAVTGRLLSA